MSNRGSGFFKKLSAYVLWFVLMALVYISVAFILDCIFRWFGDEDGVSWKGTLAGCLFCAITMIVLDIRRVRRGGADNSSHIIRVCRKIIITTTLMFAGLVFMEWLIMHESGTEFIFDTVRYLPLALTIAISNYLYERRQEKLVESDERRLVVATEVDNLQLAETISKELEGNGVAVMIVPQHSPIYIKGGVAPYQIQVPNGDLAKAKEIIARISA